MRYFSKHKLLKKLESMAENPREQLKRVAIGTAICFCSLLALILTSSLEKVWLFYLLSIIGISAIIYAVPGYIGVWAWRMKHVLFKK